MARGKRIGSAPQLKKSLIQKSSIVPKEVILTFKCWRDISVPDDFTGKIFIEDSHHSSWWHDGKLHRDKDLPALVKSDGHKEWWQHGLRHRDGDKPAVIQADGTEEWFKDHKRHRLDGPAIVYKPNPYPQATPGCGYWLEDKWFKNENKWKEEVIRLKKEEELDRLAHNRSLILPRRKRRSSLAE